MWKYLAAWFLMLLVSVANGAMRDFTYGKHLKERTAHQVSTVSGILLLGFVIHGFVQLYPPASGSEAVWVGLFWMTLTIAFEFLFFHYAAGHSWSALRANYDLSRGRVWVAVPVWLAIAPYLFLRITGPA